MTLKNVLDTLLYKALKLTFLGAEEVLENEMINEKTEMVARAICEENKVEYGKPNNLPLETKLGEKSTAIFSELCTLFDKEGQPVNTQ